MWFGGSVVYSSYYSLKTHNHIRIQNLQSSQILQIYLLFTKFCLLGQRLYCGSLMSEESLLDLFSSICFLVLVQSGRSCFTTFNSAAWTFTGGHVLREYSHFPDTDLQTSLPTSRLILHGIHPVSYTHLQIIAYLNL